ncbi:MAG: hypothetical protein HOY79_49710 [Streptomyces sp.]|nr:hypothetical protein [Streptomyces sp.]
MDEQWMTGSYTDRYGGAFLKYMGQASPAASGHMSELPKIGTSPSGHPLAGFRPGTGLFVFGLVAAVSIGLMAVSTTVRVGGASASASVGRK